MTAEPTPDELREAAEEILRRPEFSDPDSTWFDRGLGWIWDRVSDLFRGLAGGDIGSWVGLLVIAALIGGLIWLIGRTSVAGERMAPRVESPTSVVERHRLRAQEWRRRADEARANGDWAEAVRCEHRHLAAVLDERAWLVERDHRTASELIDDVRDVPDIVGGLSDVTASFENVWYGEAAADERLADAVRAVSEDVRSRATTRTRR